MSYLNKDARDTLLTASVAAERMSELADSKQVDADEKRLLRTAATNIRKVMDHIVRRVGAVGAKQLLRQVDTCRLVWLDNAHADRELQKVETYSFTSEEFDPILEELMGECENCQGKPVCAKRVLFDRVQAPEYNADHDVCQYAQQEATA